MLIKLAPLRLKNVYRENVFNFQAQSIEIEG
jgi:hypothetical protein